MGLAAGCCEGPGPTAAELVRPNIAWPTHVTITKDKKVWVRKKGILKGFVVINAGVTLKALDLKEDGSVVVLFTDLTLDIPLEDTDLFERSITEAAFKRAMEPIGDRIKALDWEKPDPIKVPSTTKQISSNHQPSRSTRVRSIGANPPDKKK